MEGTSMTGEGWETSTRRNRHGNKVAGSGARVASSTPRNTPASNRGGAGRGSRRPVSASTQIDRSELVYQSIAIELNGQNITRGELIDALLGLVKERDVLTVTRLAREWQVTFARKEPMEVIGDGGTITIGGTKFLLRKVEERSSAGRVRWISPFRLVRVHWLPGYVPDVCIHNFLSQFVHVASILPERATEDFENGSPESEGRE